MKFSEFVLSFATNMSLLPDVPEFAAVCYTGRSTYVVQILNIENDLWSALDLAATLINRDGLSRDQAKVGVIVKTPKEGLHVIAMFFGPTMTGTLHWMSFGQGPAGLWSARGIHPQVPETPFQVSELACLNPLERLDHCGVDLAGIVSKFKVVAITDDT